VCNV